MRLPLYRCHKKVRAAKIIGITGPEGFSDGHAELVLDVQDPKCLPGAGHISVTVGPGWLAKNPALIVGGYFVEYDDGYESYSPAVPFESGYTLVPTQEGT